MPELEASATGNVDSTANSQPTGYIAILAAPNTATTTASKQWMPTLVPRNLKICIIERLEQLVCHQVDRAGGQGSDQKAEFECSLEGFGDVDDFPRRKTSDSTGKGDESKQETDEFLN
jgi:hypothetical protein